MGVQIYGGINHKIRREIRLNFTSIFCVSVQIVRSNFLAATHNGVHLTHITDMSSEIARLSIIQFGGADGVSPRESMQGFNRARYYANRPRGSLLFLANHHRRMKEHRRENQRAVSAVSCFRKV